MQNQELGWKTARCDPCLCGLFLRGSGATSNGAQGSLLLVHKDLLRIRLGHLHEKHVELFSCFQSMMYLIKSFIHQETPVEFISWADY